MFPKKGQIIGKPVEKAVVVPSRRGQFVFTYKSIPAQKKEKRNTVMSEVAENVQHHMRSTLRDVRTELFKTLNTEGVLIFCHTLGQMVTEIVEHNHQD